MATISDVETALAALITSTLYATPGTPPSKLGYPVKVYPGWPDPQTLDADMVEPAKDGKPAAAHVSIYPLPGERNVTRYPSKRTENAIPAPTYTLAAAGQVVTVGGAAPATDYPQNLAVFIDGLPFVAGATAGETPAQLAAALYALIVQTVSGVTVAGATLTFNPDLRISALMVGSTGSTTREVRRQEKQFQITVWSSNPVSRAAIYDAFDPTLADTPFLTLADGSSARLCYQASREDDFIQKQRVYRRSSIWKVEYATTITESATQIVVAEALFPDFQLVAPDGSLLFDLDFSNPANSQFLPGV